IPVDFDPFGDAAANSVFPMTEAQREIWASVQMGAEASNAYNVCHAFRIRGAFSMEAMKAALQQLVDRHQALRLVCDPDGETQHELTLATIPVTTVDLAAMTNAEREHERSHHVDRETNLPFDLEKGPLCRAVILREDRQTHLIIFTAHHIVCDGWSGGILIQDLGELYEAESVGMRPSLAPAHSFQSYVEAQNKPEQIKKAEAAEQYWKVQLAAPIEPLELPLDFLRKPVKSYEAERQRRQIPAALYRDVSRVAAQNGCTVYAMLFAAMQVLIHRLTGQNDFVLGTVVAAQAAMENSAAMAGHGTNVLPVRAGVNPEATFEEHLKAVRRRLLDAFDHQSLSFGSLVRSLNLPRDPSRNPLVTVTFNSDNVTAPFRFRSVEAELLSSPKKFATFDLEFNILKTATGVFVECIHSTAILQPATVQRWLENFETLLASICAKPTQKVADLPLMTPEQDRVLLSPPREIWEIDECIHHRFERQVGRTPNAIALTSDGVSLTFAELNCRANAVAERLIGMGAGPDVLIALCVERSVSMLVGLLGILKAGAAYLPIDLRYPAERVAFILEDAGVPLLISQRSLEDTLPKHQASVLFLDDVAEPRNENIGNRATLDNLAYVIYTSGSTGKPKGVEVLHRGLTNVVHSFQQLLGFGTDDVLVATTTLSFDIHVLELFAPIQAGSRLMIATDEQAQDPTRLIALLETSGATIYQATPVRYRMLLEAGWKGMPKLQLLCGGEKMSPELGDQLLTRCATLWNVYGPTETTVWSSATRIEADGQPITVGKPIANTTFYILNPQMKPTPMGAPGELFIGGEGVARGYRKRPQLTQERFVANPFGEGRIYKTGDRARYRADGRVELLGRNDDQVKVRGFRIELGEIEHALESLPDVLRAAVVVHNDGEDQNIIAYLVPVPGVPLPPAELRGALLQTLPEYMIPAVFVPIDAMPTTPNGKLDRKALPAPVMAARKTRDSVPPGTSAEITLARMWESLLKVEKVGIHESFFDLGGHSILAARLMAQIRSSFGIQLPQHHIFRTPTISGLAALIESKLWTGNEPHVNGAAAAFSPQVEIEI
ncbi:MAG TPA: amino acid adenylation domain-containing protein, partial [Candidatus Sulfotelmatobacter sp.]|nr:amino acid adenylation domain-containing protein [Candidatus Sulfotelmatobacter sp.]